MKHWKLLSGLGLSAMLIFSGCSSQKSTDGAAPAGTPATNADVSSAPSGDGNQNAPESTDVIGIVTAISENEVTIAKNPMTMRQPGNPSADGAQAAADGQPPPSDGQREQPADASQGQPPSNGQGQASSEGKINAPAPDASPDISGWETVTFKIDEQTKLSVIEQNEEGGREESAATLSQLAVNANVRITPRAADENTADAISIINLNVDTPPAASAAQ